MIIPQAEAPADLVPREPIPDGYVVTADGRIIPWWYTKTGLIVKWSLFLAFVVFMFALLLAYWHAKKRMRKGLAPLRYHRVGSLTLVGLAEGPQ